MYIYLYEYSYTVYVDQLCVRLLMRCATAFGKQNCQDATTIQAEWGQIQCYFLAVLYIHKLFFNILQVPSWSLLLNGLGLFVYQTLDAVDGKQARRTGSSSPLGELFDHGCDALSMVIVITGAAITLKLGQLPHWMVFLCITAVTMFYLTHWRAYVIGVVRFGL